MIYILAAVFLLMWSLFIITIIRNKRLNGFYFKGMSSLMFIAIFAYGVFSFINKYGNEFTGIFLEREEVFHFLLIGMGLVAGLLGDLFLEVQYFYPEQKHYQILNGMIAFSVGHLFYISAIWIMVGARFWSIILGIVMMGVIYFGSKLMKINFGNLWFMTYLYTFIIFTMVGMSIHQAMELSFNGFSVTFMIGAILFGISDLLLAPIYFKNETSKLFVIGNLATYYLGQGLIAISIMFL